MTRILVLDDAPGMLEFCRETLEELPGASVYTESHSSSALERLRSERFDLLLTDLKLPEISGAEVVREARKLDPDLMVLVMTGFPTVETAVETMKMGAHDYLVKPFPEGALRLAVGRALEQKRLKDENRLLTRHLTQPYRSREIVGNSPAIRQVFRQIERAGPTEADVLISGESGTGKELVARSLHLHSGRTKGPFVPLDCGAIPEHLLENELFGHERGAFTGAQDGSMGLMEFASGGTFFLDEVGELPLSLQAKLLRAVQERRIRRIGGRDEIPVDVRILAASNRDLDSLTRTGIFRKDLYFRINVVRIHVPPLRERKEDIPVLVDHYLPRLGEELRREVSGLQPNAMEILMSYSWPGNVREFINVLKRAIVFSLGPKIGIEQLPEELVRASRRATGSGGRQTYFQIRQQKMMAFEKDYLQDLLRRHRGEVAPAAQEAGMPRGTLYRLIRKHSIELKPLRQESHPGDPKLYHE